MICRFDVMVRRVERVSTGKWDVRIWRRVPYDYTHAIAPATELKELVEANYDLTAENLALAILDALTDCSAVEVLDYNRNGVQLFRAPLMFQDRDAIDEFMRE